MTDRILAFYGSDRSDLDPDEISGKEVASNLRRPSAIAPPTLFVLTNRVIT